MSTQKQTWQPSHREEIISALWFIVAFTALGANAPRWVFLLFFIKACLDTGYAIGMAVREIREETNNKPRE